MIFNTLVYYLFSFYSIVHCRAATDVSELRDRYPYVYYAGRVDGSVPDIGGTHRILFLIARGGYQ